MAVRKCPKCGAVWYTALPKCAFCGIEGEEQPMSTHTGRLPEKPAPAPKVEPEKPVAAVAVAEATPVPPTSPEAAAAAEVKAAEEKPPADPAPEPAKPAGEPLAGAMPFLKEPRPVALEPLPPPPPPSRPPAPALTPLSAGERPPDPRTLPPVPLVPSAKVPLAFALHGVAAIALVALAAFARLNRIEGILVHLAAAVLIPFGPFAWLAGLRYESRCIDLGYRPAPIGRMGRLLGTAVTILLALEASALAILSAVQRISAGK